MSKAKRFKIRCSGEDRIFDAVSTVLLIMVLAIVAYPLYFVVIASVSDPCKVLGGDVLLFPKGLNVDSYKKIFADNSIWSGYMNSVLYTCLGTVLNVALTMSIAYPLSRVN